MLHSAMRSPATPIWTNIHCIYRAGLKRKPATVANGLSVVIAHRIEESCVLGEPVSR